MVWTATVAEADGFDYKGRFFLSFQREGGEAVPLRDIRWNSPHTAERTLATMSEAELRRRLRAALLRSGRASAA